jgi:hypothetical protein
MSPALQASENVEATNSFFYYQGRRSGPSQYGAELELRLDAVQICRQLVVPAIL